MLTMRQWLFVAYRALCYPVPLGALPCYPVPLGAPCSLGAKAAPDSGGGGRADGNGPTVAVTPQTIFYFFKDPQVSSSQWTLFTRVAKFPKSVLVSVPLWNQDNLNP